MKPSCQLFQLTACIVLEHSTDVSSWLSIFVSHRRGGDGLLELVSSCGCIVAGTPWQKNDCTVAGHVSCHEIGKPLAKRLERNCSPRCRPICHGRLAMEETTGQGQWDPGTCFLESFTYSVSQGLLGPGFSKTNVNEEASNLGLFINSSSCHLLLAYFWVLP